MTILAPDRNSDLVTLALLIATSFPALSRLKIIPAIPAVPLRTSLRTYLRTYEAHSDMWKCVENIMDSRLQSIKLHDYNHGFLTGRGTGTAIIEAKLTQQLTYLE